ncbi:2,4-dienoyl-CoA reductase [Acetitomaculum ruminis DSM 5522]|uniref:2,4-dienoyl-CoA reductase n=1 Tax=Acetitomaculum ruminis DSM 5522 TaxID=1120918 RepID=A0A1I0WKM6_9FIRM|nr:FAD-dependent oxidoreductase [Acetitomaculum ruminis]SFA89171.1 2,4-dienoyl-CoA reductase [Acetitomaculum ruminis DSM 5522]
MFDALFSSVKIGTMTVDNRTVFTAMGNLLANGDGTVSDKDIAFYAERAKGGTGLIITECTAVDPKTGLGNQNEIVTGIDEVIPGLQKMADEIHKYGKKLCVQIYHPGRQGIAAINGGIMLAPSQTECQCVHQPTRAMTLEEVEDMVQKFVDAAVRVKKAGCDAVEVHGAHGYLITQFLSPYTNLRTDKYGGTREKRFQFLREIVEGIKKECGDFPLLVRLSANEYMETAGKPGEGITLEDTIYYCKELEKLGVDALDISSGNYETMNTAWEPSGFDQGWKNINPKTIKENVSIPVIATSVLRDPEYVNKLIEDGVIDLMGSARQFYADAYWANKAKEGNVKDIRKCISCLYCMETLMTGPNQKCNINVRGGAELEYPEPAKDGERRVVAIVGGGPAGMEAARILAKRDFKVVLFEEKDKLGGQLNYANKPPKKEKIDYLIDYQVNQLEKLGVEVRLNTKATPQSVKEINPYAVFVALGSLPVMPASISGLDGDNVYDPVEILTGKAKLQNQKVAVIGSGMTGIETAEFLKNQNNDIEIFEMADDIGPGLFFQNLIDVLSRLGNVAMHPKHQLLSINKDTATFKDTTTGKEEEYKADSFVVALGTKPDTGFVEEFKKEFDKVCVIGDAAKSGRIRQALETGYKAALELK